MWRRPIGYAGRFLCHPFWVFRAMSASDIRDFGNPALSLHSFVEACDEGCESYVHAGWVEVLS